MRSRSDSLFKLLTTCWILSSFSWLFSCDWNSTDALTSFSLLDHEFVVVRRFAIRNPDDGMMMTYRERLRSAGDGKNFLIEIDGWRGTPRTELDPDQEAQVLEFEQHLRAGSGRRVIFQRDIQIQSLELLFENYDVIPLSDAEQAPQPDLDAVGDPASKAPASATFLLLPRHQDRALYEVTLSIAPESAGFPLGYREFVVDAAGRRQLVSSMKVLELDMSPQQTLPKTVDLVVSRESLADVDAAKAMADFPIYYPVSIPAGFDLTKAEWIVLSTSATTSGEVEPVPIFRMVFSDGIETLEISQHRPTYGFSGPANLASDVNLTLDVPLYRAGAMVCAVIIQADHQIVIESRSSTQRIQEVISSLKRLN